MKQISGIWFECKVRYKQTQEDGTGKAVTETYVYKAADFGEAYDKSVKDMSTYISGEFGITAMKIAQYGDVFIQDEITEEKYYRVKVNFIVLDEKTYKEKKVAQYYLVNADSVEKARKYADTALSDTMMDYVIEAVQEAKICDISLDWLVICFSTTLNHKFSANVGNYLIVRTFHK